MTTIAIIGSNISEEDLLHQLKDSWEVWSVNNLYLGYPNVNFTRWFELHAFKRVKNIYTRRGVDIYSQKRVIDYMKEINNLDIPVMMQKKWSVIKKSEKFPFKEIRKRYGDYFGCSFAWLIAYALTLKKIDEIRFYGIGLTGYEYFYQRPSTERMLGIAEGRGIGIYIDPTSTLLKEPYIYAIKEDYEVIDFLHVSFMRDINTSIVGAISRYFVDRMT